MKIIAKIVFWLILSIVAIYSIIIITEKNIYKDKTPSVFGYKNFIVLSGSMEPTLNIGDIVFVKETDNIKNQDIISFRIDNSVITHRVVEIIDKSDQKYYKTKGDANSSEDEELLKPFQIEGKYSFKIPKLGNVVLFLKTKTGILILGIILILSLILSNINSDE